MPLLLSLGFVVVRPHSRADRIGAAGVPQALMPRVTSGSIPNPDCNRDGTDAQYASASRSLSGRNQYCERGRAGSWSSCIFEVAERLARLQQAHIRHSTVRMAPPIRKPRLRGANHRPDRLPRRRRFRWILDPVRKSSSCHLPHQHECFGMVHVH